MKRVFKLSLVSYRKPCWTIESGSNISLRSRSENNEVSSPVEGLRDQRFVLEPHYNVYQFFDPNFAE